MRRKLEVVPRKSGEALRLEVSGDVDMDSSPLLLEALRAGLRESRALELDLRGVAYMDSSGIAVLVQGVKMSRREGASYSLVEPSPQVMAVIRLSQLTEFFTIHAGEARAGGSGT